MNPRQSAQEAIHLLGGKENVASFTYCATRIRITVTKPISQEAREELAQIDGIDYCVSINNQVELIAPVHVQALHEEMSSLLEQKKKKATIVERAFRTIAEIFTPIIPLFAGAGILKGLLVLFSNMNWLDSASGTYNILSAGANAVFYFLPIFLAFSSAKTFGVNPFMAAVIGASLIDPHIFKLLGNESSTVTDFLGIPVVLMTYSSTVIPAILAIWFYSYVERVLKKGIKANLQLVFVPLLSLLIVVPFTLMTFGPLGVYIGEWLAMAIDWMMNANGMISGAIVAGIWSVLVVFGIQWAVNPMMINNISTVGFDRIVPLTAAANFGMAGAALGVFLRTKNKKTKSLAGSSIVSVLLAGVTEPIVYGLAIPLKRPFIGAIIGSACGGAIMGAFKVQAIAFVFGSLTTIPAFIASTFTYYLIGLAVSFVVAAIATYSLGFDDSLIGDEKK
ncbi:PTS transporter subunit EIIC [Priestia taiwanensis]|uniref:PTS sucrose transporter subunit IIBC n=1 Tax=Priestia taiwanensis TaxID=1347902 RepID=A0A917EMI1_9BACI|nr:PTS transporter subunit EIIC [Priestia taiwanensis]MBM7361813.1 PTS system beta-glucosides-specific IIC component [Priestia taiwanensis]GGE57172.1 PTS sucrose transporter subunit IIBC [Priestia taiwanensis]